VATAYDQRCMDENVTILEKVVCALSEELCCAVYFTWSGILEELCCTLGLGLLGKLFT